ncbi:hypothetical protein KGS77_17780 [Streptomyces sp. MST-110588]|nr:hypothetical protein KGS77_17780 [Streptomyces sp. MST-110588]
MPTVTAARVSKGAVRKNLASRLEKGPDKTGDGCLHFIEGMVMTAAAIAFAVWGKGEGKPLYLYGGAALAVLCFFGTIAVVRGEKREKEAAAAGEPRADELYRPARYCHGCDRVFCPDGTPWQGLLTPEQFKKMVWTEAGYASHLGSSDKAKTAEVPPWTLPGR